MLNIRNALRLYALLKDFIPEYDVDDDYLEFVSAIVHNIRMSDRPEVFGDGLSLMYSKITVNELAEKNPLDVVSMFMSGLADNKFLSLAKFCGSLGYG